MNGRKSLGVLLVLVGLAALFYTTTAKGNAITVPFISYFGTEVAIEQSIDLEGVSDLIINTKGVNLELLPARGSNAIVVLQGRASKNFANRLDLLADTNSSTLDIAVQTEGIQVFGFSSITLKVELPEQYWQSLTVKSGSGNVSISNQQLGEVSLSSGSGNVTLEQIRARSLRGDIGSGNIRLTDLSGGSYHLETSSGNITVERFETEQLKLKAGSGNVKLVDGTAEVEVQTGSGNIRLNAEDLLYDTKLTAGSGNIRIELEKSPASLAVFHLSGSGTGKIRKEGFKYDHNKQNGSRIEGKFGDGEVTLTTRTGSGNFSLK